MCMSYADMTSARLEMHLERFQKSLAEHPNDFWNKRYVAEIQAELKGRAEAGTYAGTPNVPSRHLNSAHP